MSTFGGQVIGGTLKVRAEPSTASAQVGSLVNGAYVNVSTFSGVGGQEWFQINYQGITRYIMARWIKITNGNWNGAIETQSDPLRIRTLPSTTATVSFLLAKDTPIVSIDENSVPGWYRISSALGTGWGSSQYISLYIG